MEIELNVKKNEVLEEVAKTSAYSGSKMTEDEGAYERIFTTDADREMLERFWSESQVAVCEAMKKFLADEGETDDGYTVSLELSKSFDDVLQGSMEKELFSFFVMNITAKWFAFTNKKEAGDYGTAAQELLVGVRKKALYKKRPTRLGQAKPHAHPLSAKKQNYKQKNKQLWQKARRHSL